MKFLVQFFLKLLVDSFVLLLAEPNGGCVDDEKPSHYSKPSRRKDLSERSEHEIYYA